MKTITLKIKPSRKETKEERKARVQNDTANRCNVYANKKAYKTLPICNLHLQCMEHL